MCLKLPLPPPRFTRLSPAGRLLFRELPPQQLELLAAALGTAEAVIAQGAFFIGEEQRSYADRDALEAAAYLLDASDMRPAACGAEIHRRRVPAVLQHQRRQYFCLTPMSEL